MGAEDPLPQRLPRPAWTLLVRGLRPSFATDRKSLVLDGR